MERPASKGGQVTLGVTSFPIFRGVLLWMPRLATALLTCLLPIRPDHKHSPIDPPRRQSLCIQQALQMVLIQVPFLL